MANEDTSGSLQQVLRSAQGARALGRYNQATVVLRKYFDQNTDGSSGIVACTEFAFNYLAQGYLQLAHDTLQNAGLWAHDLQREKHTPRQALFHLLIAAVGVRRGVEPIICNIDSECRRVWREHLETLKVGEHSEIYVKLEILLHETRRYILLQQRNPTPPIDAATMVRLATICCQLCKENRHSEALEMAQLPSLCHKFQCPDPSCDQLGLLCCMKGVLAMVEKHYGACHLHRHIDMRAIQFQSRLFQSQFSVTEADKEAIDLVSCYEDVDYPKGALLILQLLFTWQSEPEQPHEANLIESMDSLRDRTGHFLKNVKPDSIPSQNPEGTETPTVNRSNIHEEPTGRASAMLDYSANGVLNPNSTLSTTITRQPLWCKVLRNSFSPLLRYVKGEFSEKRLSASYPLSFFESLFLFWNATRHHERIPWGENLDCHPFLLRKYQILSERMSPYFLERQTYIRAMMPLWHGDTGDLVQIIEDAEAALRISDDLSIVYSWSCAMLSHAKLADAHARLRKMDKVKENLDKMKEDAKSAPIWSRADAVRSAEITRLSYQELEMLRSGTNKERVESFVNKVQQLKRKSRSKEERNFLASFLYRWANTSDDSGSPSDMTLELEPRQELLTSSDLIAQWYRVIRGGHSREDIDALEQNLQMLEKRRQKALWIDRSTPVIISSCYSLLGDHYLNRALATDPHSAEMVHRTRLYYYAALEALNDMRAAEVNPFLRAQYQFALGMAGAYEGQELHDPATCKSALQELQDAEKLLHTFRSLQEPTTKDVVTKLLAEQQASSRFGYPILFQEIFRCCRIGWNCAHDGPQRHEFIVSAWELIQRVKARGLLDVMSVGSSIPDQMMREIHKDPKQYELLQEEANLIAALSSEHLPAERNMIRRSLKSLRRKMKSHDLLNIALRSRDGDGFTVSDLVNLSSQTSKTGSRVIFVDWFADSDELVLFTAWGDGRVQYGIDYARLRISESTINDWARSNLKTYVLDDPDAYIKFRELKDLISPLKRLTKPGDILVLCPTASLHHIPLHALEIDDNQILLQRNPVVYVPSLCILERQLHLFEQAQTVQSSRPWRALIVSVYDESNCWNPPHEVIAVRDCLTELASTLSTTVRSGPHLTVPYFVKHMRNADLVHFHGHAISKSSAFNQALLLRSSKSGSNVDHHLTASDIITSLTCERSPLVVNIACASGRQEIKPGDEPFGLTSAFLFAGARTVIGTLWPIKSADGRSFTKGFYDAMKDQTSGLPRGAIVDVARAVQKAVLEIRYKDETEAPYHWASFVAYGLWEYPFNGAFRDTSRW